MRAPAATAAHAQRLLAQVKQVLHHPVPPALEQALRTVPRHLFLPDRIWRGDGQGGYDLIDRTAEPNRWLEAAYSDVSLVTQFGDGLPTSSASMPSMVLRTLLLAGLDAPSRPLSVAEMGTATGFNAALLCALLGDRGVTTIEVDAALAELGEHNLRAAGYTPTVIRGDAAAGWPEGAPYDLVLATFSVDRLPPAWTAQTAPGGRIVTPWNSAWCCYGTLALTTHPDGSAQGRFHSFASYLPMRRPQPARGAPGPEGGHDRPQTSASALSPWAVAGGDLDAEFHVGLAVPGASFAWDTSGTHAPARLEVVDATGPSWATVDYDGQRSDRFAVTESGPRRLWEEITATYDRWLRLGRPGVDQHGLTVDAAGVHTPWVEATGRRHTVCPAQAAEAAAEPPGIPGEFAASVEDGFPLG
ncbi:protein-L-isoaspartate O-methyltransferase (plasmid) [Streptomyces nigrescens]|uniref:Protein-L-isoaspartate O-methyltransferase n=1 Tax=Streptomyces nigrescens TaxID=1920 RepID=A0ABN6R815_STRNI|nr:methyltransferase [Streptomyces nigrescens]BDM74512.1 protein-L-isoaspartate O-methyltransferase [Streptomyces nigrescens]